jgi:predicted transcriptional regulator
MNTKLYEITEGIANILQAEEWNEETEQQIEVLGMALEKKAENIVHFCSDLGAFVVAAKAEEERIADRRKAVENRVVHLKDYMKRCLESAGLMEVTAGTHKVKIQANPPRVVVSDEKSLPAKFFIVIPETTQLDKKAVAEALKKGEEVKGAHLARGTSLRIR